MARQRTTARKRFGQHFLTDTAVVEAIFASLRLGPADRVLEIGPGTGVLTERLSAEAGAVAAIEVDRDLAATLDGRFAGVDVICADALEADLGALLGNSSAGARVVGNLPYNIATPLLDRLFRVAGQIRDMHFMLQAEVAARLAAVPATKAYGRLSVVAQHHCRIDVLFDVAAGSFSPPPKVRSAFVRLTPRRGEPCDAKALRLVLRVAFAQRRKTLANALQSLAPDWRVLGIDPAARAESLSVADFVVIANHCARRSRVAACGT